MRSVLTALGIIIGVGAVIAMVGIGNGAKAQVEAQIASLGQNVILIFSGSTTSSGIRTGWGGAGTLKIEDAEAIRREVPGVIGVSEEVVSTTQVAAGNQNWFTRIFGESADYFDIRQWPLADGAPFTAQDVRGANKVCVIGRTTATQIYGNDNPIGQILRIKNVPFTITGVLTPKGFEHPRCRSGRHRHHAIYQRDETRDRRHHAAQHQCANRRSESDRSSATANYLVAATTA
jgi:putative ABC transport system permease protein